MRCNIIILLITLAFSTARQIVFEDCYDTPPHPYDNNDCTIHNIVVEPCRTLTADSICDVKKSSILSITMEYTPFFEGSMYVKLYRIIDIKRPILVMSPTVCANMSYSTYCQDVYAVRVNTTIAWLVPENTPNSVNAMKIKILDGHEHQCCAYFSLKFVP